MLINRAQNTDQAARTRPNSLCKGMFCVCVCVLVLSRCWLANSDHVELTASLASSSSRWNFSSLPRPAKRPPLRPNLSLWPPDFDREKDSSWKGKQSKRARTVTMCKVLNSKEANKANVWELLQCLKYLTPKRQTKQTCENCYNV